MLYDLNLQNYGEEEEWTLGLYFANPDLNTPLTLGHNADIVRMVTGINSTPPLNWDKILGFTIIRCKKKSLTKALLILSSVIVLSKRTVVVPVLRNIDYELNNNNIYWFIPIVCLDISSDNI